MNIAALIIGIDGWEQYTAPLIESLAEHEPDVLPVVIDNASATPYPEHPCAPIIQRTERLCYSAAINHAHQIAGPADWYIVLSNDVLCTGPFVHMLASHSDDKLVGPLLKNIYIERVGMVYYIEGWCVVINKQVWDKIGQWDEGMQISSYEDVEYSHRARMEGFDLVQDERLPFVHLDQKQRFYLVPNYWGSEYHNRARFIKKYATG